VTTGEVIQEMGLGEQKTSRGRLLEALLPRPEGLQIAGAVLEYLGVFRRMPTDNPVKVQLLIDLATRLLDEEDEEAAKMLTNGRCSSPTFSRRPSSRSGSSSRRRRCARPSSRS